MKQIPVHGIFTVYAVYLTVIAMPVPIFPDILRMKLKDDLRLLCIFRYRGRCAGQVGKAFSGICVFR